jgi:hypothetical protein
MPAQGNFTNPNDPWGFSNPLATMFGSGGYGNQNMAQFMNGGQPSNIDPNSERAKRKNAIAATGGPGGGLWVLGGPSAIQTRSEVPSFQHYDPLKFNPVGRPPATPGANMDVAKQSQVIRTPDEIRAKYEEQQAELKAQLQASQDVMKTLQSTTGAKGDLTQAIIDNLGGRQASPGGPYAPATGMPNDGGDYFAVPIEYRQANPEYGYGLGSVNGQFTGTQWDVNGNSRYPELNNVYARDLTSQINDALAAGTDPSGILPAGLASRPDIAEALTNYQSSYAQREALPDFGIGNKFVPPQVIQQSQTGLENNYNTFVQDYYTQQQTQGQAYLDMMGGGAFGGVLPSALNPQWYDATATMLPFGHMDEGRAQQQAMNSPWGQAGAPFSSQAWAGGNFNPMQGPQFSQNGQVQPNPAPWLGTPGMFNPMQFNPQLAVNAPWGTPTKPTGSSQQGNGMSFGASPWGSFW